MAGVETSQLMKVELPLYEPPPAWIPPSERANSSDYCNDLRQFLPRKVTLRRIKTTDQLGFNVRGGKEHHCGIYISKIMPKTEAERLGLQEGDQILQVNEVNFEDIEHADAVRVLKMTLDVQLTVRFFPYGYEKTYDKTRFYAAMSGQPVPTMINPSPPTPQHNNPSQYGRHPLPHGIPASHATYQNINPSHSQIPNTGSMYGYQSPDPPHRGSYSQASENYSDYNYNVGQQAHARSPQSQQYPEYQGQYNMNMPANRGTTHNTSQSRMGDT